MSDSAPPYAHLLKRQPAQARSAERVEALLDAAAKLLEDREPEAVTVRDLATAAGVPTGTLYQFFEDKDAVLQALAVRSVHAVMRTRERQERRQPVEEAGHLRQFLRFGTTDCHRPSAPPRRRN